MGKQFIRLSDKTWLNRGGGNIVKVVDVTGEETGDKFLAIEYNFASIDPEFAGKQHVGFLDGYERESMLVWLSENSDDMTAKPAGKFKKDDCVRVCNPNVSDFGTVGIVTVFEEDCQDGLPYEVTSDGFEYPHWFAEKDLELYEKPSTPVAVSWASALVDEATGEPHFCAAGGCEQPASFYDKFDKQWYCNSHCIPF